MPTTSTAAHKLPDNSSIHTSSRESAWTIINAMLEEIGCSCVCSQEYSERAGNPIYIATDYNVNRVIVSDLGNCLALTNRYAVTLVWFPEGDEASEETQVESEEYPNPFPFTPKEVITLHAAVNDFKTFVLDAHASHMDCVSMDSMDSLADWHALTKKLSEAMRNHPACMCDCPLDTFEMIDLIRALESYRDKLLDRLSEGFKNQSAEPMLYGIHDQAVKAHALMKKIDGILQAEE